MRCPKCSGQEDKVIDSRASKEGSTIRRRRECLECGSRFTTYEQIERAELFVVKRDGRRESFSKDKLIAGIKRACQKRPVSEQEIADAVERIHEDIDKSYDREVPGAEIGERVMRELRALDTVAYVRFASIYRNFEEAHDFVSEINRLANQPRPDKRQLALGLNSQAAAEGEMVADPHFTPMIQLREDCLLLQKESGETVPCSAENITVELMGSALDALDAETVRHAAAGVLHYFKCELGKEFVTVGEFAQALSRVLNGFGFTIECSKVVDNVSAQVATADLRELAKASDKGFELEFFSRLREMLHATLADMPRAVQFHGLRGCVKQLSGARRWCPRCRRLHEQIVEFLRHCLSQDERGRGCALVVR